MPCAICIIHMDETRIAGFSVLASKPTATFWWFGYQNYRNSFLILASKSRGGGLSVCASKLMSRLRRCEGTYRHLVTCFITKQVGLEFFSFTSKLMEERRRMMYVASSQRSCISEAKDGRFDDVRCDAMKIRPNYYLLIIILFSAYMSILIFLLNL
jgi:hypothetical protein